jgi:hypothetical protein
MVEKVKLEIGDVKLSHNYYDSGEVLHIKHGENIVILVNEEITWLRRLLEMV